jgi:hypothetical protein
MHESFHEHEAFAMPELPWAGAGVYRHANRPGWQALVLPA